MRRFCLEALTGEEADQLFDRCVSGGVPEVDVGEREIVHEGITTFS